MWQTSLKLVTVVALCLCSLSESQSDLYQIAEKRSSNRYCGSNLVNMINLVCHGIIYSPSINQKKSLSETEDDFWLQFQPTEEQLKFPFRSRSSASTLMNRIFKRNLGNARSGIVYECCISKGCTIQELDSYCQKPQN